MPFAASRPYCAELAFRASDWSSRRLSAVLAPSCVVDREAISVEDNGPALSVQVGGSHAVRASLLLPNDGRPFELDAVAFRILQVDRRALAFGTVARGRRTAGDALSGKMFGNRRRVERFHP